MEITKEELAKMYNDMTNKDLCKKLGISKTTLIRYLKENGIKLKGSGNRNEKNKIKIVS